MKRIVTVLLLTAVLLSCAAYAETKITVTGYGKISLPADTAAIELGVTEYADNAIDAQSLTNEKLAAIRTACIKSGIPESDISVAGINLMTLMDYDSDSVPMITGYNASSALTIRVYDIENVGDIIDTAILAGANTLTGVSFSLKDPSVYNEDVITAACTDAREKADLYAKSLGMTITGIDSVGDTYCDTYENTNSSFGMYAKDYVQTDITANGVVVYASASITYTAE